jgi:hypothetical protein
MTFSALNKREQAHAVNVNFGNAVSVAARQVPSTGDGFGSSTSDIASQITVQAANQALFIVLVSLFSLSYFLLCSFGANLGLHRSIQYEQIKLRI